MGRHWVTHADSGWSQGRGKGRARRNEDVGMDFHTQRPEAAVNESDPRGK